MFMKNPILSIISLVFSLVFVVFMCLWLFLIAFSFFDGVQLAAELGYSALDIIPPSVILRYLFLNIYFILMVIFGVISMILLSILRRLRR